MGGSARGTVEVLVAGKRRRLRVSLDAIQEYEIRKANRRFLALVVDWTKGEAPGIGEILDLFVAFAAAGGTPVTEEERRDLGLLDLQAMLEGIRDALVGAGLMGDPEPASAAADEKKRRPTRTSKSSRKKSPGGSGRR